ncbi:ATP-binding protein [Nocardiopsis sp. NPDC058789]|uniref:sensor histidine kinase n=1 Tax=Nocardiopsis sp. NPDC058789 TaxID=3346634 RepID=UPI00366EC049
MDVAVALAYVFVDPSTWWRLTSPDRLGADPWEGVALVLLLVIPAGMVLRWKYPAGAFATVLAASVLTLLGGWGAAPPLAAAWTLYPLALTWRGSASLPRPTLLALALGAPCAVLVGATLWVPERMYAPIADISPLVLLFPIAFLAPFGLSWLLGRVVRERHLRELRDAEHSVARIQNEERLRVAREVHDIVSHTLGVIGMRAGVVLHVHRDDPRALAGALAEIERTSRVSSDELRLVLGVLRQGETAPRAPGPGLAELPSLVETARAAGVECSLHTHGTEGLPATVAAAVHRVVQESLTNVVRHAPGSTCTVTVTADDGAVEVRVLDTGRAGNPGGHEPTSTAELPGSGTGLIGMRERVSLHGGSLRTGPLPGGGHRVHARFPLALGSTKTPTPDSHPTEGQR